ncbi:MAG: SDR family NAD(P)-dependent oxidoreductase [Janthinobacterium lividum]
MAQQGTVMVVGAPRGLGFALAEEWLDRGWHVIATVRKPSPDLDRMSRRFPDRLEIETVDIAHADQVWALRERLSGRRLDIAFINAGIARAIDSTPSSISEEDFLDMMLVNALSPVRTAEILRDLVPAGGTIAIMTSELGSIAAAQDGWQLYSASKAALNMLMMKYASRYASDGHALLLVAPGWVRTEMGGSDAALSLGESIPLVVDAVEKNRNKPGLRYIDRFNRTLAW